MSIISWASVSLEIQNVDTDAGTLEIFMINTEEISGFQFELIGITISEATGPVGFVISTSSTTVLGFSLTGATIPAGSAILATVNFTDYLDGAICFGSDNSCEVASPNVIADSNGGCIDADWGDCYCDTVFDECGICGGGGISDGECDCEGNVDLGCGCGEPSAEENYDCDGNCILEIDCFNAIGIISLIVISFS